MKPSSPFATAIVLAGGSGTRMKSATEDKILIEFDGKPAIRYSLDAFAASKSAQAIVIVYRDQNQRDAITRHISEDFSLPIDWTIGGDQRQDSVWAGLQKVSENSDVVLIHDGARPLIASASIDKAAIAARENGASCIAKKTTDTLKDAQPSTSGYTLRTLDRDRIWAMETPQAFQASLIHQAYEGIQNSQNPITDDLSAIEALGTPVSLIENDGPNPKLTTPQDIEYVRFLIQQRANASTHAFQASE